ncbi:hypothetical protein [Limnofasciculus baicalensis]|uniref:Uncharacterized protein n=1 Tax=Limnofasciculus baicalensis BBK-W-15 TaxID=2699891 RepID=A0AAE3KM62_9CYAN|nr:hypothetical protein [Limnofasciculus baicalensis]MCP2727348.1 hypothetical protein [Limnofasciculus baicalensis BBK-W-15]
MGWIPVVENEILDFSQWNISPLAINGAFLRCSISSEANLSGIKFWIEIAQSEINQLPGVPLIFQERLWAYQGSQEVIKLADLPFLENKAIAFRGIYFDKGQLPEIRFSAEIWQGEPEKTTEYTWTLSVQSRVLLEANRNRMQLVLVNQSIQDVFITYGEKADGKYILIKPGWYLSEPSAPTNYEFKSRIEASTIGECELYGIEYSR